MSNADSTKPQVPEREAKDFIAEADTGARQPPGFPGQVLLWTAVAWSLFQLWIVSPIPFVLNFGIINQEHARPIHLAFAVFLAYTAFPALRSSPRHRSPFQDWILALVGAFCAAYTFIFANELALRPGRPLTQDIVIGTIGLILLLEATRRALGPPLMAVAGVFIIYTFFGPYMPEVIQHGGASLNRGIGHYWLGSQGVFGVALGVSTSMVFLFVLFGSLLDKAGAGNYFIRVAFALLGHMRGGPAKAAVVSSGLTGLISGSSIANVVTTGNFTIPLMKKTGFSAEKAGAVEVAASTNGQLTPPIMGAAAFIMVEYVGISLVEVMKHAILPALVSYVSLVFIVHLEAMKLGLTGLPRNYVMPRWQARVISAFLTFFGLVILSAIVYYGLGWVKDVFGGASPYVMSVLAFFAYLGLLWYALRFPDLETADEIKELPPPGPVVKAGLYYLLPVVVLVWCLMIERMSPGLAAFWAACFMLFILVTQRPLRVLMGRAGDMREEVIGSLVDLREGLANGARNMVGIGVATAAAGLVVGTVTMTGIGLVMTEFVEFISGGNLMLMLLFTAFISILLGLGLPTTANYIVVSTLMAPVIVALGAQQGLVVPLIAVHLFVFYFGILADDTPPVGLAAFAAAAISKGDPIKTGIQGFTYDMRTAILPFLFIFNTELLLIGVDSVLHGLAVFGVAVIAMFAFAAATQRFLLARLNVVEIIALLLVSFTLFRPGFWMDQVSSPYEMAPPAHISEVAESKPDGGNLRLVASGTTLEGRDITRTVLLPMGRAAPGQERLERTGLFLRDGEEGRVFISRVGFGSQAERLGLDFGWEIVSVEVPADRPPRQLFYIPAFLLLGLILAFQWRKAKRQRMAHNERGV